jgi:hypothetical protein
VDRVLEYIWILGWWDAIRSDLARNSEKPSNVQLRQLFLRGMIPMVGFGFVDNFIMISAGDLIDSHIGAALQISTLVGAPLRLAPMVNFTSLYGAASCMLVHVPRFASRLHARTRPCVLIFLLF